MVKIHFVITDKEDKFLLCEDDFRNVQVPGVEISYTFNANNTNPLCVAYNAELAIARLKGEYDHLVFIHGDVSFDVKEFVERLVALGDRYDMVGLAGTKKLDVSISPLNWFNGSRNSTNSRYGDITMSMNGNWTRCFYNENFDPEKKDVEVACIDGLCISFNRKMIEGEIMFDNALGGFDMYDTDISLQCILTYGYKVGVMILPTRHTSIGPGIMSESFKEVERKFRDKWNFTQQP